MCPGDKLCMDWRENEPWPPQWESEFGMASSRLCTSLPLTGVTDAVLAYLKYQVRNHRIYFYSYILFQLITWLSKWVDSSQHRCQSLYFFGVAPFVRFFKLFCYCLNRLDNVTLYYSLCSEIAVALCIQVVIKSMRPWCEHCCWIVLSYSFHVVFV